MNKIQKLFKLVESIISKVPVKAEDKDIVLTNYDVKLGNKVLKLTIYKKDNKEVLNMANLDYTKEQLNKLIEFLSNYKIKQKDIIIDDNLYMLNYSENNKIVNVNLNSEYDIEEFSFNKIPEKNYIEFISFLKTLL